MAKWPDRRVLPNRDELNLLFNQQTVVGGFAVDFYWSSSEFVFVVVAWTQDFSVGGQLDFGKFLTLRVRAVRAF